ncbi:hypothetical protein BCV72DRAFT_63653 [Rhizopus microsporus var. microsporus]|uniref:Uncharacterized protein n=1 Tax=Rhizopus microsporus var. microsporus TaxID=86635 RepID=A0A1X0QQ23_RHIZD|nr:hypothetical protein BCV72DRAFT_63653 [Rhizopus microsporus var. microsporus]
MLRHFIKQKSKKSRYVNITRPSFSSNITPKYFFTLYPVLKRGYTKSFIIVDILYLCKVFVYSGQWSCNSFIKYISFYCEKSCLQGIVILFYIERRVKRCMKRENDLFIHMTHQ